MKINIIIFYLLVFVLSCTSKDDVARRSLLGAWKYSENTFLIIGEDGSCVLRNFPSRPFYFLDEKSKSKRFSTVGNWSFYSTDNPPHITISFRSDTNTGSQYAIEAYLVGKGIFENKPPWRAMYIWVQEEGGDRYVFKRASL